MIKRYNQFVKGNKTNEEFVIGDESTTQKISTLPNLGGAPVKPDVKPDIAPAPATPKPTPWNPTRPAVEPGTKAEMTEDEEVEVDKYTSSLQQLSDLAIESGLEVDYSPESKFVIINGKEITFPTETEKYHVSGVKKPFSTAEEVVAYFEPQENNDEPSFEETEGDLAKRDLEDEMKNFESKSYKTKRYIRK
jgi:hypothetical protein